jgi:hypothetical protein
MRNDDLPDRQSAKPAPAVGPQISPGEVIMAHALVHIPFGKPPTGIRLLSDNYISPSTTIRSRQI